MEWGGDGAMWLPGQNIYKYVDKEDSNSSGRAPGDQSTLAGAPCFL